ncbi:lysophospholipase i [Moniliophthora roreri MCA 2997]|uniref:Acyl-protein thioesterase 1 n=1 Tax=Moniliophthora roreri (strain MCA 2997) TaxID=1381753 RepID=V2WZ04_MONRO|nr:lysophospholipase i [Moniliophthora roreri MCA 2997]KAI3601451.1 lysophospholipase i [Moniliophthora roreri]
MAAIAAALESITVPAIKKHTATVIFVHGLGDTGHGWKPVADMFQSDPSLAHIKWVLPHSPQRPVTANMGMIMPSWFDIESFGFKTSEDEHGMMESVRSLTQLIDAETKSGLSANRIVLGGFSQGAAMSLLTGLTSEKRLAGVVALSGWLPLEEKFKASLSSHATSVPIFWGHGTSDPLVRLDLANESVDALKSFGFSVHSGVQDVTGLSFNTYHGVAHSTNIQELSDLKTWISKVLPA